MEDNRSRRHRCWDYIRLILTITFSIIRLTGIIECRIRRSVNSEERNANRVNVSEEDIENFVQSCLERLFVVQCSSSMQLLITLHSLESLLTNKSEICVLMIDSISGFYWIDRLTGGDSVVSQEATLKQVVLILKKLLSDHKLLLFASRAALFKKKVKSVESLEECSHSGANHVKEPSHPPEYYQYLSKDWQRFVTNKITFCCTKLPNTKAPFTVIHESSKHPVLHTNLNLDSGGFYLV